MYGKIFLWAILRLGSQLVWAVQVEVPPLDEWNVNIWGSYYENTILWPDGTIIKEDRDFILTVLRVLNEYMRWLIWPIVFGILIYFWFDIITSEDWWERIKSNMKSIARIVVGIVIIMLVYTAIRFVVNLY